MEPKVVGVVNPHVVNNPEFDIKQTALMFDEMVFLSTADSLPIHPDIGFLKQQGVVCTLREYVDANMDEEINGVGKISYNDLDCDSKKAFELLSTKERFQNICNIEFSAVDYVEFLFLDHTETFDMNSLFVTDLFNFATEERSIFTPVITGQCFAPDYKEFFIHFAQEHGLSSLVPPFFDNDTTSDITRIVLSKLPVPVEDTTWEDVLGFREDGKTRDQLHRIKRWMRKVNADPFDERRLSDEIDEYLYEYEMHMKHYLKKYNLAVQEAAFVTPLEILEDIVKFRPSNIIKKKYALKNQKVDLDFSERSFPGNEVAYIYNARKEFGAL